MNNDVLSVFGFSWGRVVMQLFLFSSILFLLVLYIYVMVAALRKVFRSENVGQIIFWIFLIFLFPLLGSFAALLYFRKSERSQIVS